jgi:hypothetical protein
VEEILDFKDVPNDRGVHLMATKFRGENRCVVAAVERTRSIVGRNC